MSSKTKLIESTGFLVVLVAWFIVDLTKMYNPLLVPSPLEVFKTLIISFSDKEFIVSLLATITRIVVAFLVSAVFGIIFGLAVGHYRVLDKATESLIDFLRSIPGIALFPLFILFFGIGDLSRLLVGIYVGMPIIIINTKYGVINSSKIRKNLHKLYNLSKLKMFYRVILPEASPYIFTGLKVALSLTIILTIVTEMLVGTAYGLGHLIVTSQYEFEISLMYTVIITLGLIGFMLNLVFDRIEKKIFHWR